MKIGLDFDNTLVCYDKLFHQLACEAELLNPEQAQAVAQSKTAVRDHLRERGLNDRWTELQGLAYGPRIVDAEPFPGLLETLSHWQAEGHTLAIVSHKTPRPYAGPAYDLHATARNWLEKHLFSQGLLDAAEIYFEAEREQKLQRIAKLQLDAYVDDLPDILKDLAQLEGAPEQRWLFDPHAHAPQHADYLAFDSWQSLKEQGKASRHNGPDTSAQKLTTQELEKLSLFAELLPLLPGAPPKARPENEPAPEALKQLLEHCDWPTEGAVLELLQGGWNNRVYKLSYPQDSGRPALLKHYYRAAQDQRPRLQQEYTFLTYTSTLALPTPKALGYLESENLALYSWVEGSSYEKVGLGEIMHALDFVKDLNGWCTRSNVEHRLAIWQAVQDFPQASEACQSLSDHIQHLQARLTRLREIEPKDAQHAELQIWLMDSVEAVWLEILERIQTVVKANPDLLRPLEPEEMCLSPSDFGFHNAMRTAAGPIFLDFEYAGWDDPAQMLGSFFSQFEVPAPAQYFEDFAQHVAQWYNNPDWQLARMRLLWPLHRLRWLSIALNHFLPTAAERRRFAAEQAGWDPATQARHNLRQLQEQAHKARRQLLQLQEELPQWHTLTF